MTKRYILDSGFIVRNRSGYDLNVGFDISSTGVLTIVVSKPKKSFWNIFGLEERK